MEKQRQERTEDIFDARFKKNRLMFIFFFMLVFINLFKIQVLQHSSIMADNESGKYREITIPVPRGTIYDRKNRILAMSVPFYSAYLDSWAVSHREKKEPDYRTRLKKELKSILKIKEKELEAKISQKYPILKRELSIGEYKTLQAKNLPGVVFEQNYKRIYPNNKLACHVIGFMGVDGEGLEGIELYYNGLLKGTRGSSLVLKDGKGALIHSVEKKLVQPVKGKDIQLTIDYNLQFILEEELEKAYSQFNARSVSAVIMDYENGEILALANIPNYDPNLPNDSNPSEKRNRVVTDLFEPGSTFKIVTAAAALEEKVFSPNDVIFCENGKWFVRNHYLRDVHAYGNLTVSKVIEKSSNIGTVKIASNLGERRLYEYCSRFGFGKLTGIDIPGEIRGILRPLNQWSGYSITAIPIGQEVGINALQGIRAMAVIANGGYLVKPHLLKEIVDESANIKTNAFREREQILSEETCKILTGILENVTQPGGTAPRANIEGYRISGKTGTAQKIIDGHYSKNRYVGSFSGYINGTKENLIIQVTVDEPKPIYYGGLVAAPTFKNVLWRSLQYLNIPPSMDCGNGKIVMNR
ncbi:MAG TPA: penicillin-binding protein 2 [bacterium]|nr:penicillin-binding protein 2 [bacterium]